jgi:hypothetical protein
VDQSALGRSRLDQTGGYTGGRLGKSVPDRFPGDEALNARNAGLKKTNSYTNKIPESIFRGL